MSMEQPAHRNAAAHVPILQYQHVYTLPLTTEKSPASPLLRALALSPDGQYFAGAFDRHVTIWRLSQSQDDEEDSKEKWDEILTYCIDERSITEEITCLSWMATGHILIGTNIGDVKIVLLNADDTVIQGFQSSKLPVRFVTLDPGGRMLAVVSGQSKVGLWQWDDSDECWTKVHSLPPPEARLGSDDAVEVTSIHWDPSGVNMLIVSYLNHGILRWDAVGRTFRSLLNLDKVYGGSLSPDGQHFATPNQKGTFDIYNLSSRDKLDWFHDPDLQDDEKHIGVRSRPGVFIHGGRYFAGGSLGRVNIWNTARSIRGQRLALGKEFERSQVTLLAVSSTDGDRPIDGYRLVACTQGPKQQIEIWRASGKGYIPFISAAEPSEPSVSVSPTGASSTLVTGMLIGGLAVHAASSAYMGLL